MTNKFQYPNSNDLNNRSLKFEHRNLVFICSLVLAFWDFLILYYKVSINSVAWSSFVVKLYLYQVMNP
jgi:hypothetical protein